MTDTKFKKGWEGGPGRPKGSKSYSTVLKKLLEAKEIDITWKKNSITKQLKIKADENFYYGVAAAQIVEALGGDTRAAKEIADRVEGKAVMPIEVKERKEDDLDEMSERELREEAEEIIKKLSKHIVRRNKKRTKKAPANRKRARKKKS